MKLEVGESLIRSWLRHVKACQLAELNWKPSSTWVRDETQVGTLLTAARAHLQNLGFTDVFKNQKITQIARQAEIDVLGTAFSRSGTIEKIYSVDIAFHANGLGYQDTAETVHRILKKLLRSAFVIDSIFGPVPHEVIFASPVVGPTQAQALGRGKSALDSFFAQHLPTCTSLFFVNQIFWDEIYGPVIERANLVADTSELFLRSYQLAQLAKKPATGPEGILRHSRPGVPLVDTLRFELHPDSQDHFKAELLRTKSAQMTIHYRDGHTEQRTWDASNFQASSNLMGNLRSRPEFRQGEWQRRGIASVTLRVGP